MNKVIEMGLANSVSINNQTTRPELLSSGRVHRVWGTLKHAPTIHVCVSATFDWSDEFASAETAVVCRDVPAPTFGRDITPCHSVTEI